MFTIHRGGAKLCDGLTRREALRLGGLGVFGLSMPQLLRLRQAQAASALTAREATPGRAKSCIVLFLMGGPPQHSTWDPKPDAPAEVRGDFKPIATNVPGLQFCELMPHTARQADKICVLRAMSTDDNAHSSSGYYTLTGYPHQPKNFENANPGPPNDYPSMGAVVNKLRMGKAVLRPAVTMPSRIFNTDGSVWPGQTAGFLGRNADPWLFTFNPTDPSLRIDDFTLPADVSPIRLQGRSSLRRQLEGRLDAVDGSGLLQHFDKETQEAFDLLRAPESRKAFQLDQEPASIRERYGHSPFGRSVLLARRLVQAGVTLIQVNWYRGPDEPADNPCWDSHVKESERLKTALVPSFDQAYSALLDDLSARGMLDETLVVCMAEFGRTPKILNGGRGHWGHVYSVALAGGGVRGGQAIGASDKIGGLPKEGRVQPEDLTATIFHCLGYAPNVEIPDALGRPLPISRGEVIRQTL
jgi:hypothetical protein